MDGRVIGYQPSLGYIITRDPSRPAAGRKDNQIQFKRTILLLKGISFPLNPGISGLTGYGRILHVRYI